MQNPKKQPVEIAAIIPARAGIQGIPYKNLEKLADKSLLEWAIDTAFAAERIDVVIVSTEDEKIKTEAERLGAIVAPRPAEHSQPTSPDAGWYDHAVRWMESEHGWKPDLLVNLRPTGPLRRSADVDAMIEYMLDHPEADGLKSVIPAPIHPYKMWRFKSKDEDEKNKEVGEAGELEPMFDNEFRKVHGPDHPRQKIQEMFPVYWQDAQVDITKREFVLRDNTLTTGNVWGRNIHGYILDPETAVDLDEPVDFARAEKILKRLQDEGKL